MIGTKLYMAPEVIAQRPYDNKVDLWSIGVILYECLTTQYPIDMQRLINFCASKQPEQDMAKLQMEIPR